MNDTKVKEPVKTKILMHKGSFHVRLPKEVTTKLLADSSAEFRSAPIQICKIVCDYYGHEKTRK